MSDDIKELVKRLRAFRPTYGWPEEQATIVKPTLGAEAADALARLVAERDQLLIDLNEYQLEVEMLEGKVEQLMEEAQEAKE